MSSLDAVRVFIFDVDGTLIRFIIDYSELRSQLKTYFLSRGLEIEGELRPILPAVDEASRRASSSSEEEYRDIRAGAMAVIDDVELEAARSAVPLPGVNELMELFSSGKYLFGLCTRNSTAAVKLAFDTIGLVMPEPCVGRGDVPDDLLKPNPHHPLEVLRLMGAGLSAGNACLVGDSPIDIEAARAAGMTSILVGAEDDTADVRIPDLFALVELISK